MTTTTTQRTVGAKARTDFGAYAIDRVAADLVDRHGEMIMLDALEFSATHEDAEDAYQRSLELLLTKAPSHDPNQLVPWLRTVVRNEAHRIRRARRRHDTGLTPPEDFDEIEHEGRNPADTAEAVSRVQMGFEALGRLKQDQIRCLLAQAEGLEYDEIADATGFTRRKVSRCIEHGRAAFTRRFDEIAKGSECERMQPLIGRVLKADADAALQLRPHIRHCLACRRQLRDRQAAHRQLAALMPPALVVTGGPPPTLADRVGEAISGLLDRLAVKLFGVENWSEIGPLRKMAAVVTIVALAVGGGVLVKNGLGGGSPFPRGAEGGARGAASTTVVRGELIGDRIKPSRRLRRGTLSRRRKPAKRTNPTSAPSPAPQIQATPQPEPPSPEPVDDGSAEFAPGAAR